jgi:molecular chaperone GrpE
MSKKKNVEKEIIENSTSFESVEKKDTDLLENGQPQTDEKKVEVEEREQIKNQIVDLQNQLEESKDKYLRLSAEFDNYRKRTQREKMDLIKYASEDVMKSILPLIDDFDRAIKSTHDSTDIEAVKQGLVLIQVKFLDFLKSNGVKEIEAIGLELDTDVHEAITKIPVEDNNMKGKIVDVVEKGYKLNDKVIRFSKVVMGE